MSTLLSKTNRIRFGLVLALLTSQNLWAMGSKKVREGLQGTVRLNQCSASLVALENQDLARHAWVITNGHCINQGTLDGQYPDAGEVLYHAKNKGKNRAWLMVNGRADFLLDIVQLVYATMTQTDLAIYEVSATYLEIERETGVKPLILAKSATLNVGTEIVIPTSYWEDVLECQVDQIIYQIREGHWTWGPSIRLTRDCKIKNGASGSPLVRKGTREVVGLINTAYENGKACDYNNPCEIDPQGRVTIDQEDRSYGQYISDIYTCLNEQMDLDLAVSGCRLPGVRHYSI